MFSIFSSSKPVSKAKAADDVQVQVEEEWIIIEKDESKQVPRNNENSTNLLMENIAREIKPGVDGEGWKTVVSKSKRKKMKV